MYQNERYLKRSRSHIFNFIKDHPFATLVIQGDHLLGTHIPVLLDGDPDNFRLYGHISDHYNRQKKYLKNGLEGLFIFQGAHGYISSSWYEEKEISTWNYTAVHVNVKLTIQDEGELRSSLKRLVHHFEKNQRDPLYYEDLTEKMIETHIPQITGFWGDPFHMEAVDKLHQGYPEVDVKSAIRHLEEKGDPASLEIAKEMRKEHENNENSE